LDILPLHTGHSTREKEREEKERQGEGEKKEKEKKKKKKKTFSSYFSLYFQKVLDGKKKKLNQKKCHQKIKKTKTKITQLLFLSPKPFPNKK